MSLVLPTSPGEAELTEVDGRRIAFAIRAKDGTEGIGIGI
jgi:predicted thioesterase